VHTEFRRQTGIPCRAKTNPFNPQLLLPGPSHHCNSVRAQRRASSRSGTRIPPSQTLAGIIPDQRCEFEPAQFRHARMAWSRLNRTQQYEIQPNHTPVRARKCCGRKRCTKRRLGETSQPSIPMTASAAAPRLFASWVSPLITTIPQHRVPPGLHATRIFCAPPDPDSSPLPEPAAIRWLARIEAASVPLQHPISTHL